MKRITVDRWYKLSLLGTDEFSLSLPREGVSGERLSNFVSTGGTRMI